MRVERGWTWVQVPIYAHLCSAGDQRAPRERSPRQRLRRDPRTQSHPRPKMDSLFAVLVIVSLPMLARASEEWCYHDETCNDVVWAAKPIGKCNGQRQSPIDIVTANVMKNTSLTKFSFTGYNNRTKFRTIANIGHTVTLKLMEGVEIRGGGLSDTYVAQQFHLHWGNTSSGLGSEHTVDGRRYPMELHVVHLKKGYDLQQAQNDPEGIAVLGFLIEATNGTQTPESWRVLTSHLRNISEKDQSLDLSLRLSLNDLLSGVDRSKYYRYKGSLTTPNCSEAVVWTVFQQPLRLSGDLIDLFSTSLYRETKAARLITNIYRSVQPLNRRTVETSSGVSLGHLSLTTTLPLALLLLLPAAQL